jgi:hypothetical protein
MTDAMFDDVMPGPGDFRRAKVYVAAWATGDLIALGHAAHDSGTDSNPDRFINALTELLVHGYDLRDNPEALAQWRADIAKHAADENEQNGDKDHGQ